LSSVLLGLIVFWVVVCTVFDVVLRFIEEDFNKSGSDSVADINYQMDVKRVIAGNNVIDPNNKEVTIVKKKRSKFVNFMLNSSMYTNSEKLMRTDNGGKITCLNGIRVLSMIWIVFGHSYNYLAERGEFLVAGKNSN
jgi:hypothetical protein